MSDDHAQGYGVPCISLETMVPQSALETLSRATVQLYTSELHEGNWVDHAFRFLMSIVSADMANYGNLDPSTFCGAGLTPRQSEVAYWLTEGKTNPEIARLMKIQVQTVKGYVSGLFDRLGTGNRLALVLTLLELARSTLRHQNHSIAFRCADGISLTP